MHFTSPTLPPQNALPVLCSWPPSPRLFSYMMHALVFASRAFFDSPRGRWIFKMMLEAFFLYTFHSIQLMTGEGRREMGFGGRPAP